MDTNTTDVSQDTRDFLERMLRDAGMYVADPDKWEAMIDEQMQSFGDFFVAKLLNIIPADKMDAFISLYSNDTPLEDVYAFLHTAIPKFQEESALILEEFREIYFESVDNARKFEEKKTQEVLKGAVDK